MKKILLIPILLLSIGNIKAYENEYFKVDIPETFKEEIAENGTYKWISNDSKNKSKQILQDFIGFFSVAECQCYPVNAKYYLSLEGLDINPDSRSRSKAELTPSRQAEIKQMRALTKLFEKKYL